MNKKWIIALAIVLMFALVGVGTAYAQEEPGYPVETETEQPTETETPPETEMPTETETPAETESPTDLVEPSETLALTEDPTVAPSEEPTPNEDNPVCDGARIHPVLDRLANSYNADYEEIVGYFCDTELGVGEIALALATVKQSDGSLELSALLSRRLDEGLGWGEIWQSLGLTGSGKTNGNGDNNLKKNQDRNPHQDKVKNEGEDDRLQSQSQYTEQKGNPLVTPPGLEDKTAGQPASPPGQEGRDKEEDNNGNGNNPGNGSKP